MAVQFERALEESYQISDRIIGKVMEKLQPDDLFMVLSDHGFESWRRGFDANAWLEQQGYLTVKNRAQAQGGYLQGIDWAQTKAYAVGLSSMYLNLSGRERFGAVGPAQADNLIAEIKDKLMTVHDDAKGSRVFSNIYTRHNFSGVAIDEAPDISFGFDGLHQVSKSVAAGAVGSELFEDNMDKWSGEHASSDLARLPGIFFCNKSVEADDPNILDLGVTALGYLGADVPSDFEGRDLFA
jgi:predicted AlkP superfamily phosphohydrolase/phosphomutase